MTEKVDAGKMGGVMGLFNFSVVLPAMMTPGVSTLVTEAGDYSLLFLIIALCLGVSLVFWGFVRELTSQ